MKVKQIKGKVDILLVADVPIGAENIEIKECEDNWKFLCRLSELTEEQAEKLVERDQNHNAYFKNYDKPLSHSFIKAKGSFYSLLEANGITPNNPYQAAYQFDQNVRQFHEAEQNVFNPSNTIIFIKDDQPTKATT